MAHTVTQLGQSRPANTTAVSAYSPGVDTEAVVHNVIVCNTSGSVAKFRLFLDLDGTTYDEGTALAWDEAVAADSTYIFEVKLTMNNSAGNLAVRTDTANALTFTLNGEEFT